MSRVFSAFLPFFAAFTLSSAAVAAPDISPEDFRLFCGYLDALENPKIKKLKGRSQEKAIAKLARIKHKTLMAAIKKTETVGATCDEVGKLITEETRTALEEALGKARIAFFDVDFTDPSFVITQVTWRVGDRKKVLQDASLIAKVLSDHSVITRTIALRGVDLRAKDWAADEAMLWEAKTNRDRAVRIDKTKITDWAESRYKRLFDGIVDKTGT